MQPKAARNISMFSRLKKIVLPTLFYCTACLDVRLSPARNLATRILLGILMSLCLALSLLLVDIVRRAVVEAIKAHMNG